MDNKLHVTGAQAIVALLRAYGVDTIFGIPGVHTLPLYEAIRNEPALRHVLARHEQGAGFMAEGYARATGRPGVVCTITGPGVTNVATPVASAYSDSIPLLVISTSLPRASTARPRGELHELKNQLGMMEALVGWSRAIDQVEELPAALHDAFRIMRQGRPRGAYLQIPLDLLDAQFEMEPAIAQEPHLSRPTEADLSAALRLIHSAQRPLIIAGNGVTSAGANQLLLRLAERLQAPILLGSKSHDVVPTDHPLTIATRGDVSSELNAFVAQHDLALVIGSKLAAERTGDGRLALPSQLIQIDIDPTEIGRNYRASVGIVADAGLALEALLEALHDFSPDLLSPAEEVAQLRLALSTRTQRIFGETLSLLDAVREGLPRDGIVVADMTILGYASSIKFPVYEPRTFIHPSELCTIGCGLPLALGAKVSMPDKAVVALCGDGGFLLNAGEMATAVQEKIPVVIVIFNDSTYTAVKNAQRRRFNGQYIATDLQPPDYVALARAFHAQGVRAGSAQELCEALHEALKVSVPTLIEVPLPPKEW